MRTVTKIKGTVCPKCGASDNIVGYGFNRSGSQRCRCNHCGKIYTLNPKTHEYPEDWARCHETEYDFFRPEAFGKTSSGRKRTLKFLMYRAHRFQMKTHRKTPSRYLSKGQEKPR